MSDILDEVIIDAKDEKKLMLFHKILPIVITFTIVGAIAVSSYGWYQKTITSHNQKIGDIFLEIISRDAKNQSITHESLQNLIDTSQNRQAELADLKMVDNLIDNNKTNLAIEKLENIINNKNYYEITTSLARILWIGLVIDQTKIADDLKMKIRNHFQYFNNKDQVFFANATLMKAIFYKKNAQNDLASQYANIILEIDDAPMIIKEQARAILSNL